MLWSEGGEAFVEQNQKAYVEWKKGSSYWAKLSGVMELKKGAHGGKKGLGEILASYLLKREVLY